jgi:hypothetical protein
VHSTRTRPSTLPTPLPKRGRHGTLQNLTLSRPSSTKLRALHSLLPSSPASRISAKPMASTATNTVQPWR